VHRLFSFTSLAALTHTMTKRAIAKKLSQESFYHYFLLKALTKSFCYANHYNKPPQP